MSPYNTQATYAWMRCLTPCATCYPNVATFAMEAGKQRMTTAAASPNLRSPARPVLGAHPALGALERCAVRRELYLLAGLFGPLVDQVNRINPGTGYTALFVASALTFTGSVLPLRALMRSPGRPAPHAAWHAEER